MTSIGNAGALGDVAWWQTQPLSAYHGSSGISPNLNSQRMAPFSLSLPPNCFQMPRELMSLMASP